VQNGTGEDVKKIVTVLNEAEVPSEDVVGEPSSPPEGVVWSWIDS
jgi:triosephosphate isomerase